MTPPDEVTRGILARCEAGGTSAEVALMELLIATEDAAAARELLGAHAATFPAARRVLALLERQPAGAARVAGMLASGMDRPPEGATIEEGIAFCRKLFDWSVSESEEASVALYSLGDPSILASATDEIVQWLDAQGTLGISLDALDLGCGIGRMEVALASRLRTVTGIDVSGEMLTRARGRCAHLPNVRLEAATGTDLAAFASGSFDLVLAVDIFPYLVQSGLSLAAAHVEEAARVLRPGGQLVILNFSYRDGREQDVRDVARFAHAAGLEVVVGGTTPFAIWDALAFRLAKGGPQPSTPSDRR